MNKEQKKPQEAEEKLAVLLKLMPDGGALIMQLIHANFISRNSLRKLLEEMKIKGKLKREGNKSQQDQIWGINYGLKKTIDDILAEIEKL